MLPVGDRSFHPPTLCDITGLILAGGQGQRMGGDDKGLITLGNSPLVAHVSARFAPQVSTLLISANRNADRYANLCAAVIADNLPDFPGPLAGLLSGLQAARTPWLATVPCDSPFLPHDLVARLAAGLAAADNIAVARVDGELQPVFALVPTLLRDSLADYLLQGGRKITRWFSQHPCAAVDFEDVAEAFMNVNTPAEHAAASARLCDG